MFTIVFKVVRGTTTAFMMLYCLLHDVTDVVCQFVCKFCVSGRRMPANPLRKTGFAIAALAALCTALPAAAANNGPGKDGLVLGILPIFSPERLARQFQPLADYLSERLGRPVRMETAPDFETFVARTAQKGRYDLLYTAPHLYYLAQRQSGYRVVARIAGRPLDGVIVTSAANGIHGLEGLRGRTIAVPDNLSLATLLIRQTLVDAGLEPGRDVQVIETPTHNASIMSVVKGFTDAAGLMTPPYNLEKEVIRAQVRVIAQTDSTPHMPFSVAPWLDPEVQESFAGAMLEMDRTEAGKKVLGHLSWPGLVAAEQAEYDIFRSFAAQIGGP